MTRVHPGASVVVIGTRWNEADLIGTLLAEEPDRWTYVNIPAIAEVGIPDALGRAPGTGDDLGAGPHADAVRRHPAQAVGSRAWYALYQGVPIVTRGWLVNENGSTLAAACRAERPVKTVIGVDPSDTGSGDSCGIVAASLTSDGTVAVIADVSAPMTSDQWARAAVELAIDLGRVRDRRRGLRGARDLRPGRRPRRCAATSARTRSV